MRILKLFAACGLTITLAGAAPTGKLTIVGEAVPFAPGIASTEYSEVRLTISPDGRTALWFSRNRPGGAGGYDIWISHRSSAGWSEATPVSFNTQGRDFDPAFSRDGRFVYFCSDRPGGLGGDDIYRVAVTGATFGKPENLGPDVNSAGNEFAPMLALDGARLLFASDRPGGAGKQDLYTAYQTEGRFAVAKPLAGAINTPADEFDATFLSDGSTIVFSRAPDLRKDRIDLFHAIAQDGLYNAGTILPLSVNDPTQDSYGPMLDWSNEGRLTFSGQRAGAPSMELYLIDYRLD